MTKRVGRAFAYPLALGSDVPIVGRIQECANLIEPGARLLDVGCSSGWLAPLVLGKGFTSYVGLDRVIVGTVPATPSCAFLEGSIFQLPFRDAAFDAVCLFDVIEHLPRGSELEALKEARRVLRPNGKLYFSTPHASPLHTPLDPVWLMGHRHYRRVTITRLLLSARFRVDRLFVAGGVVEGLDHIRLLAYKHILHRPLPRLRPVIRLIERSHGANRPLGMTLFAVASR
jgi:SAM-dependent methyltransferase